MKCKAYFTVEATLIMPMIFLFLFLVIYLGFFQYNRCLLDQDAYILAMTESRKYYQSNGQMYQNIANTKEKWEWKKYISFKKEAVDVEVGTGKITITAKGQVITPIRFFFLENGQWDICIRRQSQIQNPVFIMRNYKKLDIQWKGEKQ